MFGLMTEREHESIMLDLECELVHERKQGEALRKVQDPEVKAKLSTAAKTVLGNFAGQIEG